MQSRQFIHRAFFKPDQLGTLQGLDAGLDTDGRGMGYTQAYHKADTEERPYRVVSEYVAARIGQLLGLPIPPCAITHFGPEQSRLFSSLDFNFERVRLTPIFADTTRQRLPLLCAGVLVFDIYIGNEDRHDENIVVDRVDHPRRMQVFDHDNALLSGFLYFGAERLQKLTNDLGVTGKPPLKHNRHVFIDEITSDDDLFCWVKRVEGIPDFFIEDLCEFAKTEIEVEADVADHLALYLKARKRSLRHLIVENRSEFPSIQWQPSLYEE